jgi:hypothetical protein
MSAPAAGQGRPGPAPDPALARLLGPGRVEDFAAQVWSRDAYARDAASGADLTGLFTLADADELLSVRGLRTPFLRVVKDGVVQADSAFSRGGGVGATIGDQVDADRVARLLADGCTVVFQGLHRVWPAIVDFTTTLTTELGHPVQVNAYLTPASAQGLAPHYDTHDVFVLQTAGAKRWTVHRPVVQSPAQTDGWTGHRDEVAAAAAGDPALDRVLRPGDVLYLPRGWIHCAQAQSQVSLHLTIGVHPYTRRHLAEALLAELFETVPMGESLPLGLDVGDPHALDATVHETRTTLTAALDTVSADRVAARLDRRWAADTRPAPVQPLQQAAAAASVRSGLPVWVRRRPGARLRVQEAPGRVSLVVDGRPLHFDPDYAAALAALAAAGTVDPDTLPGLDRAAGRELVARLLLEGAVVPVALP